MTVANTAVNELIPEKTLYDVLRDVWRAKFLMLSLSIFMAVIAFAFLSFAKDFYRAEMIIAPASPMGQGLRDSAIAGEGTLRVQDGDFQSNTAFLKFENIYDGVSVSAFLVKNEDITSGLAFDRAYEFSNGRSDWSAESLSEYIGKRVRLEPVSGTPLRRMVYLHPDKKFAIEMIKRIHRITDEMIRARILVETNQRIDYLNVSLSKTTNPDHRRSLANLLMEQERLKMMVSLDQPYAASIIEPAFVSARPRWPDPYIIYPVFVFIGLLSGFVIFGLKRHE